MDFLAQLGFDTSKLAAFASQLNWATAMKIGAEIIIITYAAFWLWRRIVGTQAERLVKGVMVLMIGCFLSWLLGFTLITSILQQLIPVAVLAILIIFQPEIRRGLLYLGRTQKRVDWSLVSNEQERSQEVIRHIIAAVRELSRTRTGALIVVEPPEGERDYLSPGTTVNADVSTNLLLSIFFPNSPLHDGAVIIRDLKVVAAGVILPMTDNPKLSYRYGTRHRAAIGLSELYDGLCIVVSEETGSISAASRGMLVRYAQAEDLGDPLSYLYNHDADSKTPTPLHSFLTLFARGRRKENGTARDTTNETQPPALREDAADTPAKKGEQEDFTPYVS